MVARCRAMCTECSIACMGSFEGGHHYLHYLHHSLKVKLLSCVQLFATPWTVAYQAPPSMGFFRQEYWSGLPFPSPGDLPDPGIEPRSPAVQADALTSEPPGNPYSYHQDIPISPILRCPLLYPSYLAQLCSSQGYFPGTGERRRISHQETTGCWGRRRLRLD